MKWLKKFLGLFLPMSKPKSDIDQLAEQLETDKVTIERYYYEHRD